MISVIIPVYKAEKYFRKCVDSILSQTYKDLEVILVNDGSPDSCPVICEEYSAKDNRITVVHKNNAGVSAARNSGLDIATGDYVTFVDSDDYIEPDMYEKMMEKALQYDCDVVMCDCVKDTPEKSSIYTHDIRGGFYNYEQLKNEYYPHLLMMENVEYPATISNCLILFKRELSNVRYIEGIRFSEDLFFGAQLMYYAHSFYYMKEKAFYHYVMNDNSASHSFCVYKWDDYILLYAKAEEFFLSSEVYDFQHQLDLMLLFFVYNALGDTIRAELRRKDKKRLQKRILANEEVMAMFNRIKIFSLPISTKLKIKTLTYRFGFVF